MHTVLVRLSVLAEQFPPMDRAGKLDRAAARNSWRGKGVAVGIPIDRRISRIGELGVYDAGPSQFIGRGT